MYEAVERATNTKFAAKVCKLKGITEASRLKSRQSVLNEVKLQFEVVHHGVVGLKKFYVEKERVVLILEIMYGGTLLDAVLDKGGYSEHEARRIFKQLLETLAYLHAKGIVHRDVKLENMMVRKYKDLSGVKLLDMGFALKLEGGRGGHTQSMSGTPVYLAPEVVKVVKGRPDGVRRFTVAVDIWAAGCALFLLLGGYPPFEGDSTNILFDRILAGEVSFLEPVWESVSMSAKRFIKRLLDMDAKKRVTAEEALQDPWFTDPEAPSVSLTNSQMSLLSTSHSNLRAFSMRQKSMSKKQLGESGFFAPPTLLQMMQRHNQSRGHGFNLSLKRIFSRNKVQAVKEPPSYDTGFKGQKNFRRKQKNKDQQALAHSASRSSRNGVQPTVSVVPAFQARPQSPIVHMPQPPKKRPIKKGGARVVFAE